MAVRFLLLPIALLSVSPPAARSLQVQRLPKTLRELQENLLTDGGGHMSRTARMVGAKPEIGRIACLTDRLTVLLNG